MRFFNTLTNKIEEFVPNEEGKIRMYTCGPTVYHYAHIGNIRTYVLEDIFEKSFRYLGYDVERVMNITDVGHLQSDGDTGEDKMSIASKREKKSSKEIAEYYTNAFFEDCSLVHVDRPKIISPATDNIDSYIQMIEKLLKEDKAYINNGNIYFDTSKDPSYYELSGRDSEQLMVAVREDVEKDMGKRNLFDFGLWFTNSKYSNQELQWDSPWGRGYPGWHIECSCIAIKYLGEYLDIHMGAEDAIFPHHTNEIAQSEAYLGHKWCNYWVHLSFLNVNHSKMSKSKGDILRVKDLKSKGYNPLSYRLFILNTHYRNPVNFSFDILSSAERTYQRLKNKVQMISNDGIYSSLVFQEWDNRFKSYLENDLNTANTITLLYDLLKSDVCGKIKLALIQSWDQVFCLDLLEEEKNDIQDQEILDLIQRRAICKKEKNFQEADKIRSDLLEMGIQLIDSREGTTYKFVNKM
ncbi:MAG: cysteine--tRNA ligase [Bacilli bacterium]|nr:cysteine--tRNA ligase [Bacilli bacterium]